MRKYCIKCYCNIIIVNFCNISGLGIPSSADEDEEIQDIRSLLQATPSATVLPDTTTASLEPVASTPTRRSASTPPVVSTPVYVTPSCAGTSKDDFGHISQIDEVATGTSGEAIGAQSQHSSQAEEGEEDDNGDEEPAGIILGSDVVMLGSDVEAVEEPAAEGDDPDASKDDLSDHGTQVVQDEVLLAETGNNKKGNNYDYLITCFGRISKPPKMNKEEMWYLVYQREVCPKTKREHWQGFVQFITKQTYKQANFLLRCGHCSLYSRKGTPLQCKNYCIKAETRLAGTISQEFGFCQPRTKGVNAHAVYHNHMKLAGATDRTLLEDTLCADYMAHKNIHLAAKKHKGQRFCYVVTGDTGTGKSEMMRAVAEAIVVKRGWAVHHQDDDPWWQDYEGQEIAVFNEFDGGYPFTKFKQLVDSDTKALRCKHGSAPSQLRVILICSNQPTCEWYPHQNAKLREPVMRRVSNTWTLTSQGEQLRISLEIMRKIIKDLAADALCAKNPPAFRKEMGERLQQLVDEEMDVIKEAGTHTHIDFVKDFGRGSVGNASTVSNVQQSQEQPSHNMLSPSASMVCVPALMPSISDTSAVFSSMSQSPELVPLTTSALRAHNEVTRHRDHKRAAFPAGIHPQMI